MDDPRDTQPPTGGQRSGPRRVAAALITAIVLAVIFVGVIPRFADYDSAWSSIQAMPVTVVTALAVATVVNVAVYPLPFQVALPGVGYLPAFMVRQTTFLISNTVPAGGAFGLGVQYAMLSGYGVGPAAATAAIGATSVWNIFVTLGLPVVGAIALVFSVGASVSTLVASATGLAVLGALIGGFVAILRRPATAQRLGAWADRVVRRIAGRFGRDVDLGLTGQVVAFRGSIVDLTRHRWRALTLTSTLQQLSQFTLLHIALTGLQTASGHGVTVAGGLAAFAVARVATLIPITPGGLGTTDAALAALLVAAGASSSAALAAVLVWRAASFVPQIVIGGATFLGWRAGSGRHPGPSVASDVDADVRSRRR